MCARQQRLCGRAERHRGGDSGCSGPSTLAWRWAGCQVLLHLRDEGSSACPWGGRVALPDGADQPASVDSGRAPGVPSATVAESRRRLHGPLTPAATRPRQEGAECPDRQRCGLPRCAACCRRRGVDPGGRLVSWVVPSCSSSLAPRPGRLRVGCAERMGTMRLARSGGRSSRRRPWRCRWRGSRFEQQTQALNVPRETLGRRLASPPPPVAFSSRGSRLPQ